MQITTFRADADGGSAFTTVDIAFPVLRHDEFGHAIRCSQPWVSPAAQFVELPAGMDQDWHNAPARQVVVVLEGVIEVETTDGQTRRWGAGEVFLPADIGGRGHRTRCIGGAVRLLFAPLPEGCELSATRS